MGKTGKVVLTVLLLASFGAALWFALRGQSTATAERDEAAAVASSPPLTGLIALDVEPFFADPRVKKILADKRLSVAVTRVGSREMASMVQPGATADFLFPSGVVAANQIAEAARKAKIAVAQSSPFYTPLVIASWQPIAKILVANGMAKPLGDRTFGVDTVRNFIGAEETPAYQAIGEIRGLLDTLNPGKEGDLLAPNKILGVIPFGNKPKAYFRKFESAGNQLHKAIEQLYAAKDEVQLDIADIEATRGKLWDSMQKLAAAAQFARALDERLAERVTSLKSSDPERAKALEQEVLFYARQNLQDILTQQAVCVNGYLALDVLKKTGREMMNGCNRVATTGMSALAVAQTVARATGNQVATMDMLKGVNATIGTLIEQTGKQLNTHVERTAEFATNPMIGIETMQSMFDPTSKAMDAKDTFRSKAIDVMGKNNEIIRQQVAKSEGYVDRVRQQRAREAGAAAALEGPVAL